ncbi:MAG: hypothetical protein V4437_02635 [Patescibacteria group bacterium]
MLYTSDKKSFQEHVHPKLQRRIRMFLIIGVIMLVVVVWDIWHGTMGIPLATIGMVVGAAVGFLSSRILHLSWDHDGQKVVGRIDTIGWFVLGGYIAFEIARSLFFEKVVHTGFSAAAIAFTFVATALIARVFGLRGKILEVLKEEKIFG